MICIDNQKVHHVLSTMTLVRLILAMSKAGHDCYNKKKNTILDLI